MIAPDYEERFPLIRLFILLSATVFFTAGCSAKAQQLYSGPALPQEQAARLITRVEEVRPIVFAVDGVRGEHSFRLTGIFDNKKCYNRSLTGALELDFLPGAYALEVGFFAQTWWSTSLQSYHSEDTKTVDFGAKPGRTYLLRIGFDQKEESWWPEITDITGSE